MKTWYSAKELVGLNGLPKTASNISRLATKKGWEKRQVKGKKGIAYEYALTSLPKEVQQTLLLTQTPEPTTVVEKKQQVVTTKKTTNKVPANITEQERMISNLTDKQRQIIDARTAIVAKVQQLLALNGKCNKTKTYKDFVKGLKDGTLPEQLLKLAEIANAKPSKKRAISLRTLQQWVYDFEKQDTPAKRMLALAPKVRQQDKVEDLAWISAFLGCYRTTTGRTIAESYEIFAQEWANRYKDEDAMLALMPSYNQVTYALAKLPLHIKEFSRRTGADYRAILPYVKRDWNHLKANDVWVGDGHSMKMKVAHPDTGRPFIPELTLVIDAASRFIVGWSLALSESAIAVGDAIRHGVTFHGIPSIYYSDNGGGEKNWQLDGELTGLLPRLGIHHETGIPGNPQGRGIIERLNSTIALRIARQFATYHGTGVDRDTARKIGGAVISYEKAMRKGRTQLTAKQQLGKGKLPTWKQLIDEIRAQVQWYNEEHIHSSIGTTPAQRYEKLCAETEIYHLTEVELRDIPRPRITRKAQRGWLSVFNNDYFHADLINVDGQEVQVSIDIHDPQYVEVYLQDGRHLLTAELNGNKRQAFPESLLERTRKQRAKNRQRLLDAKQQEINDELNPTITLGHKKGADLLHGFNKISTTSKQKLAVFPSELRRQQQMEDAQIIKEA